MKAVRLKSSGQSGGYDEKDLWNRCILYLSLEWKRDDGWCDGGGWWQMINEVDGMKLEDYFKDWVMHNGMSDLWFWERKMTVDERWWWAMTNECDKCVALPRHHLWSSLSDPGYAPTVADNVAVITKDGWTTKIYCTVYMVRISNSTNLVDLYKRNS